MCNLSVTMQSCTYNVAEFATQAVECSVQLQQEAAISSQLPPNETCSTNNSTMYPTQAPSVPATTYTVKLAVVSAIAGLVVILAVALVIGIVIMK